jgi:hypothetical protein
MYIHVYISIYIYISNLNNIFIHIYIGTQGSVLLKLDLNNIQSPHRRIQPPSTSPAYTQRSVKKLTQSKHRKKVPYHTEDVLEDNIKAIRRKSETTPPQEGFFGRIFSLFKKSISTELISKHKVEGDTAPRNDRKEVQLWASPQCYYTATLISRQMRLELVIRASRLQVSIYLCRCIYKYIYIYLYVRICLCIYIYIFICKNMFMYIYIYIHIYIYIYICDI